MTNPTVEQRIKDNPFYGWLKTSERQPVTSAYKVRVRRVDGSKGFSLMYLELDHRPQIFWKDLDGTEHEWSFYPEYAYLKKHGGLVQ